jgi:tetratricopeptide (TPR) repeat protein
VRKLGLLFAVIGLFAPGVSQTKPQTQLPAGNYSDEPRFEAGATAGSIDAGGYSSPAEARRHSRLLQSLNELNGTEMQAGEKAAFEEGTKLLLNWSLEPAAIAFKSGLKHYPRSAVLRIGLSVAEYSSGQDTTALRTLVEAADVDPRDARAYPFLGQLCAAAKTPAAKAVQRLRKFAELEPNNSQALYNYAICLAKDSSLTDSARALVLLKKAVTLDPAFVDAHLQLGDLYFQQQKYPPAIEEYLEATRLQPDLADGHYRLARAYLRSGDQRQAEREFQIHARLRKLEAGTSLRY